MHTMKLFLIIFFFNLCSRVNSYPRPLQPNRLSTSRINKPSSRHFSSLLNESGSSTFWCVKKRRISFQLQNLSLSRCYITIVSVIRSISCLSLVLCCRNGEWPFNSLYSIQPRLNQSADESYGVPFDRTSGAM